MSRLFWLGMGALALQGCILHVDVDRGDRIVDMPDDHGIYDETDDGMYDTAGEDDDTPDVWAWSDDDDLHAGGDYLVNVYFEGDELSEVEACTFVSGIDVFDSQVLDDDHWVFAIHVGDEVSGSIDLECVLYDGRTFTVPDVLEIYPEMDGGDGDGDGDGDDGDNDGDCP